MTTQKVFGVSLMESIDAKSYNGVPFVLYYLFAAIERQLHDKEMYKSHPEQARYLPSLFKQMNSNIYGENIHPYLAATAVETYLSSLTEPIITKLASESLSTWMQTDQCHTELKSILFTLPRENRNTLRFILCHLKLIASVHGTNYLSRLCFIFAPKLMGKSNKKLLQLSAANGKILVKLVENLDKILPSTVPFSNLTTVFSDLTIKTTDDRQV
jgi:hypothetical protein